MGSKSNRGRRMRGRIFKLVLLAAVSVVMLQGGSASANTVSVPLGQTGLGETGFGDIVVDDTNDHVFVSNPSANSITVLGFGGNVITTITSLPGAFGMVIHGSTLYVAEETANAIEAINLSTLTDAGPVAATGLEQPKWLAYAGGKLWTNDDDSGANEDLESVTLGGNATTYYLLDGGADQGAFPDPEFATSPATPNVLYVWENGGDPGPVYEYDVSTGTPVQLASNLFVADGMDALAVSPDGTRVIPSALSSSNLTELSASTLTDDGTVYPAATSLSALAVSPADGGLVATGLSNRNSTTPADISVFKLGLPATTFMASTGPNPDIAENGLAMSADGSRLFAITSDPITNNVGDYDGSSYDFWSFDLSGAAATGSNYIWNGSASSGSFSSATNWASNISPISGSVGTLTFPNLATGCGSCESVVNDVPGLIANGVEVDADDAYHLSGNTLTIGSDGLSVAAPTGNGSPPTFALPILLGALQTWTIGEGPVSFTDPIVGNQNLSLDFEGGSIEPASAEVGDISATGDGGFYLDGDDAVDSADGSATSVAGGAGIEADRTGNSIGPVTIGSNGWLSVGEVDDGAGELSVDGPATFTSGSELDLAADEPFTISNSQYSQLTATGDIVLNGGRLNVTQGLDPAGDCDDLHPGDALTLVSSTGTISGTFSNYANGAMVDIENDCDYSPQDASGTLSYSAHTVTLTITNGGDAAEFEDGPVEVNPPSISGSPVVGQTLQLDPGTWQEATSYDYSWYACGADTCDQIPNATTSTFKLTSAQLGDQIAAIVVANGPDGTNGDDTDLTDTVTAAPVPVISTAPAVTGTTTVGSVLSAAAGTWTNSPGSYAYQWERCSSTGTGCAAISGATAATYTLTSADTGFTIEVVVAATNTFGAGSPAASKASTVVSAATTPPPTTTPPPATTSPVSAATVKNDLRSVLAPTGQLASLKTVLAHHGYAFAFKGPAAGKLTVTWVATVKRKTVTLGKASLTLTGARTAKVTVRLTAAGTIDLKRYARLKIKSEVGFKPTGLKQVNESATFTLAGPKTAHTSSTLAPKQLPRSAFTHRS
jgi:hypothetical protein